MRWSRRRVIAFLFLGAVLIGTGVLWWLAPLHIDPPFDVDAFLAHELFDEDRAPAVYREILPLVDDFDARYPGAWDSPSQDQYDPVALLMASEEIALRLVEAGKLPPGVMHDPRTVFFDDLVTVSPNMRGAGRLLVGRAHLLLDQGEAEEALEGHGEVEVSVSVQILDGH